MKKNRQTYYGAVDLFHDKLIVSESEKGDGRLYCRFYQKILPEIPLIKLIIFWDGARTPASVIRRINATDSTEGSIRFRAK
jgi:hypothetical protein